MIYFSLLFFFCLSSCFAEPYLLNRPHAWDLRAVPAVDKERQELRIALWNLQTQYVSDNPQRLRQHPKYRWKKRLNPIVELIKQDRPDVLGLCEFNLLQAHDLKKIVDRSGYELFAISAETLKSVEEVTALVRHRKNLNIGEFVGVLYKKNRLYLLKSHAHRLKRGKKHARVLVETHFLDLLSKKKFVVLTSHFDHLSATSRQHSAQKELALIKKFEKEKLPWFSLGDRNWSPNEAGQKSAMEYVENSYITDFRDDTLQGHFGVTGTFPGHLGFGKKRSSVTLPNGLHMVHAPTIDVGFRSKTLITGINSYTYTGEFDPQSYKLLPFNISGDVSRRNFASDHFYHGGTFRLNS